MFEVFERPWELGRYQKIDDARNFAIEKGWRKNPQLVQLRFEDGWYIIEPYERDCNCPNLIEVF